MGSDGRGGVTSISTYHDNWADCDLGTQGRAWLHGRWQGGLAAHTPSLDQIVKQLLKQSYRQLNYLFLTTYLLFLEEGLHQVFGLDTLQEVLRK
jgi:hypothetical protein